LCLVLWISEQKANISQYNIKLSALGSRWGVFTARYEMNISIQCRLMLVLTPRRSLFDPSSVHVKFVLDRLAPGQDFLRVPRFFPGIITQPVFHIHQLPAGLLLSFPVKYTLLRRGLRM